MSKSQKRSAALSEKFWFRKNITSRASDLYENNSNHDAVYSLMSINEIINGKVIYILQILFNIFICVYIGTPLLLQLCLTFNGCLKNKFGSSDHRNVMIGSCINWKVYKVLFIWKTFKLFIKFFLDR